MSSALKLRATRHPDKVLKRRFEELFGIDSHKQELISSLRLILQPDQIQAWQRKFHPHGLPFFGAAIRQSPLVLLSGDVGCGKTELAQTVGTPLSKELGGETVITFEVPSDVRGTGLVGEVSSRITSAFSEARRQLKSEEYGLLIIDEADDLATSREQDQAHHEDRVGVNALIKEIDDLERDESPLAVILITNRPAALDPAVLRRAGTHLHFSRPDEAALLEIFQYASKGLGMKDSEIQILVAACLMKPTPFSYSDIFRRIARSALLQALAENKPIEAKHLQTAIETTSPTPLFKETTWKNQKV